MTTETPTIPEIITEIRATTRALSVWQRSRRKEKMQKSYEVAAELTVLYRLYLKIRGKAYEEVHKFNEHTRGYRKGKMEHYRDLWGVSE